MLDLVQILNVDGAAFAIFQRHETFLNPNEAFFPSKPTRRQRPIQPLAAPASVASVGAALCLKIHFFFEACYIEAAQNFIEA